MIKLKLNLRKLLSLPFILRKNLNFATIEKKVKTWNLENHGTLVNSLSRWNSFGTSYKNCYKFF